MKKVLILFIVGVLLSTYSFSYADGDLDLVGEGVILMDMDTGEVLYEKNSNSQFYPASTTKIMTAILALEKGNMDDIVTIDQEVVNLTSGSHIALEPGEQMSLEHLMQALLVESANDAALAIAKYVSGSIEEFSKLMNQKAKEVGALNTNFVNPNGLPNEDHKTTPYDLAMMARYAMKNEKFRSIVGNYTYTIPVTNKKSETRYLKSSNRLLYSNEKIDVDGKTTPIKYDGVNGVKTGYTVAAQQCLVTSFEKDGHKLIAVVLKSTGKNVYSDTHKLLNYGIENFEKVKISFANRFVDNFNVNKGVIPFVAGVTKTDSYFIVRKDQKSKVEEKFTANKTIDAPISKGQVLGKVEYLLDGKVIAETDIVSTMDIEMIPSPNIFKSILSKWYILILIALVFGRIVALNKRKRRQRRRTSLYRI
ncbi:D-alanyl-D-alanine carboxypeptidase family protein [Tissierella sp. MB52-C2]|uniref:D-alanyl-D-alanine carboxypeptidase family protein n=1 Tax=Tissierella sp. MB52-C2 TaxID=3070999 RepID=UPI00280BB709|nr:D-alanyl-D-alanine carboxypeptidase family protein [Tissierella sp. MB52-C2]WMM23535.1 D-alanyl-D-alanine carboxypeptidase family protein [Tissierella sp. MB52-C2]